MEKSVKEFLSDTEKKAIGRRMLRAFKERGIEDKEEIAKLLGYKSANVIYKIANGQQEMPFAVLDNFTSATGCSINWLIRNEGPMEVEAETPPAARVDETAINNGAETARELLNETALIDLIKEIMEHAARAGAISRWIAEGEAARNQKEDLRVTETPEGETPWAETLTIPQTKKTA